MDEVFLPVHGSDVEKTSRNDIKYGGTHAYRPKTEPEGAKGYVMVRV